MYYSEVMRRQKVDTPWSIYRVFTVRAEKKTFRKPRGACKYKGSVQFHFNSFQFISIHFSSYFY
jgi:hypothetical protein